MSVLVPLRNLAMRSAPRWLRAVVDGIGTPGNAPRVLYANGLVNDADSVVETAGLYAGLPQVANDDALPYLGRDRLITRGPSEPSSNYSPRLTDFRNAHRQRAGTPRLLIELWNYYAPNFKTITYVQNNSIWYSIDPSGVITRTDNSGSPNWQWDAFAGGVGGATHPKWWRFWIIIDGNPFFKWKWGDGHIWGAQDLVWGTTMPAWFVNGLRGIVKTWKAGDTICDRIILKYDDSLFLPTNAPGPDMPGGDWDLSANRATSATYLQGVS